MRKSSSLPKYNNLNGLNVHLPKLTRNSWITNSSTASDYKYKRGEKFLPKNYMIMNRDKLDAIENNYYEMRYLLNDKINRIEKNQRKFNEILQYSLEQNRLQNDINSFNYDKHIQNYKDKNFEEKEYLINILNQMPQMIEKKINKILLNEYEASRNQKQFVESLREKMIVEMKNQRMYDYLKYKKQINELIQMKEYEEKEKLRLLNKIQEQKIKNKLKDYKYKNQLYNYNSYALLPFYLFNPYNINNRSNSLNSSIDEFMKIILFKEMMGSYKMNDFYQNYMNELFFQNKKDTLLNDYLRSKNKRRNLNSSFISTRRSEQYKYDNSKNGNSVPFINTGKSYVKKSTKNKNGDKRFMTSHEGSKKDKDDKTNKTAKKSDKAKTTKKSKNKSNKSSKSKSDSSSSGSKSGSESKEKDETKKKEEKKGEGGENDESDSDDESGADDERGADDGEEKKKGEQNTNNDPNSTNPPGQAQQTQSQQMQPPQIQQMQPQQIQQMQPQQIQQMQSPQQIQQHQQPQQQP